jgi:hypothetical protein
MILRSLKEFKTKFLVIILKKITSDEVGVMANYE